MSDDLPITARYDVPADVVTATIAVLHDKRLAEVLAPFGGTPRVQIEAALPDGLSLAEAHHNWQAERLAMLDGVAPFARQAIDAITPPGLVRITCECVHEPSGGMSSYYGFRGYFVSLLVSVPARQIWDARGEEAS